MKTFAIISFLSCTSFVCPRQCPSTYQFYKRLSPVVSSIVHNRRFKSQKGQLNIVSGSGKIVKFVDSSSDVNETDAKSYDYMGEINSISSFFIHEMGYELGSVVMVTKSGKKIGVWGVPLISPRNKLAVSLSQSVESGLIPNGIQVLRIKDGEIIDKCNVLIKHLEPKDLRWINDNSFVVKFQAFNVNGERQNKFYYKIYSVE